MFWLIAYLFLIFFLLCFLIGITVYTLFLIYSSAKGSPYVPSKQKEIDYILAQIKITKGKRFIDVGCGDGRVVRAAVKNYNVKGVGVDINPILIYIARLYSLIFNVRSNINFVRADILKISYKSYSYIYIFLMPSLITKLKSIFEKELKKGTIVISHGFPVIGWENKLTKKISHVPFPTYYYRF